MRNHFLKIIAASLMLLCNSLSAIELAASTSQEQLEKVASPHTVLKSVGQKLFNRINDNQLELAEFPRLMNKIVEEELIPFIDYKYVAFKVLGKHLRKSTKAQRVKFVEVMRSNIIRSYATILRRYNGQRIIYQQPKTVKSVRIASIPIQIVEGNKPSITLNFKLRRQKNTGNWLIFDVLAEGVSMLSSKQAEISKRISQYGLEQVIQEIKYLGN